MCLLHPQPHQVVQERRETINSSGIKIYNRLMLYLDLYPIVSYQHDFRLPCQEQLDVNLAGLSLDVDSGPSCSGSCFSINEASSNPDEKFALSNQLRDVILAQQHSQSTDAESDHPTSKGSNKTRRQLFQADNSSGELPHIPPLNIFTISVNGRCFYLYS